MSTSRRSFLKSAAVVSAVSAAGGAVQAVLGDTKVTATAAGLNKWRGRVAINFNKSAVTNYASKQVDIAVVKKMVDDTIMLLSGKTTVGDAWKEIFPATLSATSKIAIKTNFYALPICPPPEALLGIVEGLRKMVIDGKEYTGEVTLYEGLAPNSFTQAKYDDAAFKKLNATLKAYSSSSPEFSNGKDPAQGETKYVSLIDQVDFLINVFSARGHETYTEGVSLGFKSHYGTYINAPISSIHGAGSFSQRVRNLQCTGAISKKQVLSISCAFYCNNEGDSMSSTSAKSFATYVKTIDPDATCESPSTIIMSTDAVSCEMQAIKLLRLNKGKPYGAADMPKYLRASAGVTGALSDKTYDIGEIDEAKMEIRKIINGSGTTLVASENRNILQKNAVLKATSLRSQHITHFEFRLPAHLQGANAQLSIHDIQGRLVFTNTMSVQGVLNHFSWDQRAVGGVNVGSGKYVATISVGGVMCRDDFIV